MFVILSSLSLSVLSAFIDYHQASWSHFTIHSLFHCTPCSCFLSCHTHTHTHTNTYTHNIRRDIERHTRILTYILSLSLSLPLLNKPESLSSLIGDFLVVFFLQFLRILFSPISLHHFFSPFISFPFFLSYLSQLLLLFSVRKVTEQNKSKTFKRIPKKAKHDNNNNNKNKICPFFLRRSFFTSPIVCQNRRTKAATAATGRSLSLSPVTYSR